MFGITKPSPDAAAQAAAQREAEIERAKKSVRDLVMEMREASPETAAKLAERIKKQCAGSKVLPFDYKQKANDKARELERNANMRAADNFIREAARLAAAEKMKERAAKLGKSREYFSKACSFGAEAEWKAAYQRLTDTVMMTGGVHKPGPSRAKPLDIAPRTPNKAKA